MRDMMAQIRDVGDGIRGGTYTMTAPVITGGSITGVALSGNTLTNPVITGGSINNTPIGATTASTGKFSTLTNAALTSGRVTYAGTSGVLQDDADFTFNGTTVTMANDASISGLTVGKGTNAVSRNTALGISALVSGSLSGNFNTALGWNSLNANTTGQLNVSVGDSTMLLNTTGTDNTAVGQAALGSNTSGSLNTALGRLALYSNTTASENTAVGYQALYSGTTTPRGTAVGYRALYADTSGYNTAVGYQAGVANTSGGNNTFVGYIAGSANTTGTSNSAFGTNSFVSNTTGSNNTALGVQALQANTTASNNTAVGYQAGYSNTTGIRSTLIGTEAGYSANPSSSVGNTLVGWQAGYNSTGNGNTFIGVNGTDAAVGWRMTTGSKNTIIGGYSGNQGGLDIRTDSNNVIISDGDGNRVISSYNGGTLALQGAVTSNGAGIAFPATQSASSNANTLDDYEEGTWTPVLEGDGTNPTVTYNAANSGTYTKIGNLVTVNFNLFTTAKVGGTGNILVGGLPFACANSGTDIGAGWCYNLNLSPIGSLAYRFSGIGSTQLYLEVMRDDDLPLSLALSDWPGAQIALARSTITYRV
jgi:hypothetical protein